MNLLHMSGQKRADFVLLNEVYDFDFRLRAVAGPQRCCHGRISASILEAYPWNMWLGLDVQAELEKTISDLKRMSTAELSSLRDHHSHEVAALQDRLKTQHEEHEQQLVSLTARHAKEVQLDPSFSIA